MRNVRLLIIDPQVDFCVPGVYDTSGKWINGGTLYVAGADKDTIRLSSFIDRAGKRIKNIDVTLDSHHPLHIAHPVFWVDANGHNPAFFTIITADDVRKSVWRSAKFFLQKEALAYVESLEQGGRYPLCIWPPHCLIGSPGAAVETNVFNALNRWSIEHFNIINYVTKGSNPLREHYSAVKAEVYDPSDPTTGLNVDLITTLEEADEILIAGEALSHCVANTVRDIATSFKDASYVAKMTLLLDCSSSVADPPGTTIFTDMAGDFVSEMVQKGMRVMNSVDWGI